MTAGGGGTGGCVLACAWGSGSPAPPTNGGTGSGAAKAASAQAGPEQHGPAAGRQVQGQSWRTQPAAAARRLAAELAADGAEADSPNRQRRH